MTSKVVGKVMKERDLEKTEFTEGIRYFNSNCQRLGIELKHDPEIQKKAAEKVEISDAATMMKIKERTKNSQQAIKDRQKRKNRMQVEQDKQQKEI